MKKYIFLKYGYFADYKPKISLDFGKIEPKKYADIPISELVKIGNNILLKSISDSFAGNCEQVVPISGGLDSRAILSYLIEFTSPENIYTYTFGTPGTFDYEIGNLVAKKFGTKHITFDLTKHGYSLEEEIEVSRQIDSQTYLFHHPPIWELSKRYQDKVMWSGYIGDWVAGKHLADNNIEKKDAVNEYLKKE